MSSALAARLETGDKVFRDHTERLRAVERDLVKTAASLDKMEDRIERAFSNGFEKAIQSAVYRALIEEGRGHDTRNRPKR